jgi:PEP-CTERM motif
MRMNLLYRAMLLTAFVSQSVNAGFTLSIDPADLNFVPGNHAVDVLITHDGVGPSTLSSYTMRFGNPANASLGADPAGVVVSGATPVLAVGTASFNAANNQVANTNLSTNATVPFGGSTTLFSLNLNLGSAASYILGVDFRNAQRDGALGPNITSEFFSPNSATTDFTFTLNNVSAVPEPSSLMTGVGLALIGVIRYRRRRK